MSYLKHLFTLSFLFIVSLTFAQDSLSIDAVNDITSSLDSSVSEVISVIDTIKETEEKDLDFWLNLITVIIMPLVVKLMTRLSRLQSKFNFLWKVFRGIDTMAIVILSSMLVSGVAEAFELKFFFIDTLGDYFALALSGSIAIYELTKKFFGRTPKAENA